MRRFLPLLVLLVSCSASPPIVTVEEHVAEITGDRTASAGYVASRFDALGIERVDQVAEIRGMRVRNVIGRVGDGPEVVIVGAHHDAVEGSPGADDNASGVAVLLKVAARLARKPARRTVLFIAFGREEVGLLGSAYYAQNPVVPLDRTTAMVNLDMVGRYREKLVVIGVDTADEWESLVDAANADGLPLKKGKGGIGASDHTHFYLNGVPVLHLFTGAHEDHHRKTDTPGKLNYDGMRRVADFVERLVRRLADGDRPTWRKSSAQVRPVERPGGKGPRPYLGFMPDFTFDGKGVAVQGARAGSPAEKAGLKKGDVIVAFDGEPVADLREYSSKFYRTKPGQTVVLTVVRDGKRLELEAVVAARGQ